MLDRFLNRFYNKKNARLIVHVTYHKCMTVYFIRVFKSIAEEMGWYFKNYEWGELEKFMKDAKTLKRDSILMIGHRFNEVKKLPRRFKGSHIVRDPRDLLISGYRYHKWTQEYWVHEPLKRGMIFKLGLKKLDLGFDHDGMTYQQILNKVDQETGLIIELNWRRRTFDHMMDWNYEHSNIKELRYEQMFGKEEEAFRELFMHYGFDEEIIRIGLNYVRIYSFDNQKKTGKTGDNQHLTKGVSGQWKEYFSEDLKALFKERHQDLLIKLGYEKDDKW